MKETIGFIGLGSMGRSMAENLLKADYALNVYNRTISKTEPLVALGARVVSQPAAAASAGGIVVSIVSDDAALEEIVTSPGFFEQLGQGGIHLSMSTISPVTARKLADLHAQQGSFYVDAPVFGAPQVAAAQKLWIATAGPQDAKARVRPLLDAMGQGVFDFGEVAGAAATVKLGSQFIQFTAAEALAEVMRVAKKSDIDPMSVLDMYTQALYPIAVYHNFGKQIALNPEYMIGSWIARKDVGLFNEMAAQKDSQAPVASLLHNLLTNK